MKKNKNGDILISGENVKSSYLSANALAALKSKLTYFMNKNSHGHEECYSWI